MIKGVESSKEAVEELIFTVIAFSDEEFKTKAMKETTLIGLVGRLVKV